MVADCPQRKFTWYRWCMNWWYFNDNSNCDYGAFVKMNNETQ